MDGLFVVFFCFFWCVCSFARERASERASVCTGRGAVDTRIAANPKGFFAPKIERSGLIIVTRVRGFKLHLARALIQLHIFRFVWKALDSRRGFVGDVNVSTWLNTVKNQNIIFTIFRLRRNV